MATARRRGDSTCCLSGIAQRLCGRQPAVRKKKTFKAKSVDMIGDVNAKSRFKSVVLLDTGPNRTERSGLCQCLRGIFMHRDELEAETSLPELVMRSADPKAVAREAVVLVMVGLPARGKSYLSGAVFRHLRLLGVRVRSFNAGELRRASGEAGGAGAQAEFFSMSNKAATDQRERLAMTCCESLLEWIRQAPPNTSSVGILDATNTTVARRERVLQICRDAAREMVADPSGKYAPMRIIFLESLCDDPRLLKDNYRMKLRNDDYKKADDHEAALQDFQNRVAAYESVYEPVDDQELEPASEEDARIAPAGCVKLFNGGEKIICCRTGSSLVAAPICSLLHAMHLTPRRIILVAQMGEDGVEADPGRLSALHQQAEREEGMPIDVLCSADRRGAELARHLESRGESIDVQASRQQPRAVLTLRALKTRNMETGDVGVEESYADLVRRMRSEVILLIERLPRSVLVVCPGEDVRRVLMAHFLGCESRSIADMKVPANMALQLSRDHKGFMATELPLPAAPKRDSVASPNTSWLFNTA